MLLPSGHGDDGRAATVATAAIAAVAAAAAACRYRSGRPLFIFVRYSVDDVGLCPIFILHACTKSRDTGLTSRRTDTHTPDTSRVYVTHVYMVRRGRKN